jgi:hypothetical protein
MAARALVVEGDKCVQFKILGLLELIFALNIE